MKTIPNSIYGFPKPKQLIQIQVQLNPKFSEDWYNVCITEKSFYDEFRLMIEERWNRPVRYENINFYSKEVM